MSPSVSADDFTYKNGYLISTDNLVSDMISTVEAESPDILLLGAGPRFMTDGEKSMTSFFGLFRKKVDDVLEHASCPVAIFVNRDYHDGDELAVLINGSMDRFLFAHVRHLLENGDRFIRLYYFSGGSEEYMGQIHKINKQYANSCPCWSVSFPCTISVFGKSFVESPLS